MSNKQHKTPFVALGASLAGIYLVIVLFFLIFAKESASLLIGIAWAFAILGMVLALFQYLSLKPKRK